MKTDGQIAAESPLQSMQQIGAQLGLTPEELIPYGRTVAKVDVEALRSRLGGFDSPKARYINVTAITPTPFGEGKTTTSVALTQGLGRIGKRSAATLRQPSMGPTFGIKGGAAGGGYSQVIPMEAMNLHLTGDIHAISAAHNLLAAGIDARIYHEDRWSDAFFERKGLHKLNIDPGAVAWRRVVDISDRGLRNVITGLGDRADGPMRQTGFDITVASELMAILALARSLPDLRERIGRIIPAWSRKGDPITADDFGAAGAMAALLKDAFQPNLLQTIEGQPVLVHAGPFANIAHGNSSIVADDVARSLADYVITEAGFAADIGFEKFCNIKCRTSGQVPDAVVLVATVRALKYHGGGAGLTPGKKIPAEYETENVELVRTGCANLAAHIRNVRSFGLPVVVAINAFPTDTAAEREVIRQEAMAAGARDAVVHTGFADGGRGTEALAEAVVAACDEADAASFRFSYELSDSIEDKLRALATGLYGADDIEIQPAAAARIKQFSELGHDKLPVCVAKTHLSISHDPKRRGAPAGYVFPIRDLRLSAGAGFLYALAGDIRTMPGLPSRPGFMDIDLDPRTGGIIGLS
ncbi:formate--tetrahydrofolate ligase [Spirochaeta africana]|uniref:Formate--tetrahydrofolate ligase n=1 Tax=Spirochaeta africana (strain ATCC 700263 / DSM 8902 / Z-7692) TaxID=889378 RepID=H9UG28_SPIAZ|nr:formate--tetrahydrofolate ligase [Spirochaeta africana]AFG36471.1 formyltetrahydrofolate synthetase [Spirochaeta africana DSM 8902]